MNWLNATVSSLKALVKNLFVVYGFIPLDTNLAGSSKGDTNKGKSPDRSMVRDNGSQKHCHSLVVIIKVRK
jgi:hypothetical protein